MKIIAVLFTLLVASHAVPLLEAEKVEWNLFKAAHRKRYSSVEEEENRLRIYQENSRMIAEHNERFEKGEVPYSMKMNEYGDLSHEEFVAMMGLVNRTENLFAGSGIEYSSPPDVPIPKFVDWREKGAVTPVKNQGQCGSCWSFSVTGAIESHLYIKTGKLISLSEQNLIDCTRTYGNNGCKGGWLPKTYQYVIENDGIDTEESYPYEGKDGVCRYNASQSATRVGGYVHIATTKEYSLAQHIANTGPVSITFDASHKSFQFVENGIYYEPDCSQHNPVHAMLVVGYGTEDGTDYWIVKNSWGPNWGDQGYFKVVRNNNNHCGIATDGNFPTL